MFTKGMRMPEYEYKDNGTRVVYVKGDTVDVGNVSAWTYKCIDGEAVRVDLDLVVSEVVSCEESEYGLICILKIDSAYLADWKEIII